MNNNMFLIGGILIMMWLIYTYNSTEHFTDIPLSISVNTNLDPTKYACANMIEDINYYPHKISSFIPLNFPDERSYNLQGLSGQLRNIPNVRWTNDTYIPVNATESWVYNTSDLPRDHYPFGTQLISPNSIK